MRGLSKAWGAVWLMGLAATLAQWAITAGATEFPMDSFILPVGLAVAWVAARIAKGEGLLTSHGGALEAFGEGTRSLMHARVRAQSHGVSGLLESRWAGTGIRITLTPDPPLDKSIRVVAGGADGPGVGRAPVFPAESQILLRGTVRGTPEALAFCLDQAFRTELDEDLRAYQLEIRDGSVHATVPLSWKADRIEFAVERIFEVAAHLMTPASDRPPRLLAIARSDGEPEMRLAAAGVLLRSFANAPEASALRTGFLASSNADEVLLAARDGAPESTDALARLVRDASPDAADAAHALLANAPDRAREAWTARLTRPDVAPSVAGLRWLGQHGDAASLTALRQAEQDEAWAGSMRRRAGQAADSLRARLEHEGAGGGLAVAADAGGLAVADDGGLAVVDEAASPARRPRSKA